MSDEEDALAPPMEPWLLADAPAHVQNTLRSLPLFARVRAREEGGVCCARACVYDGCSGRAPDRQTLRL